MFRVSKEAKDYDAQPSSLKVEGFNFKPGKAYVLVGGKEGDIKTSCGACGAPYVGPLQRNCLYCQTQRVVCYIDSTDEKSLSAIPKQELETDFHLVFPFKDTVNIGKGSYVPQVSASIVKIGEHCAIPQVRAGIVNIGKTCVISQVWANTANIGRSCQISEVRANEANVDHCSVDFLTAKKISIKGGFRGTEEFKGKVVVVANYGNIDFEQTAWGKVCSIGSLVLGGGIKQLHFPDNCRILRLLHVEKDFIYDTGQNFYIGEDSLITPKEFLGIASDPKAYWKNRIGP